MTSSDLIGEKVWFGRRRALVQGATFNQVQVLFDGVPADHELAVWRDFEEVSFVGEQSPMGAMARALHCPKDSEPVQHAHSVAQELHGLKQEKLSFSDEILKWKSFADRLSGELTRMEGAVNRVIELLWKPPYESIVRVITEALDVLRKAKVYERNKPMLRVESAMFPPGELNGDDERGCRFIVTDTQGADHVVAEWRGDGISTDTIFVEKPKLSYGATTTPWHRCVRMAFELAHWHLICAMLVGPSDGELKPLNERREEGHALLPIYDDDGLLDIVKFGVIEAEKILDGEGEFSELPLEDRVFTASKRLTDALDALNNV